MLALRRAPRAVRFLLALALVAAGCDEDGGGASDAGPPLADAGVPSAGQVTLASLYDRLVDPARLAEMPAPFHHTLQSSSYDRRSVTPGNDDWFANRDWNEFVRMEDRDGRTEMVLLDATGPGAIVRLWSASPSGTLRVYLDDAEEPALEEDMEALMRGMVAPFDDPFSYTAARGANLYIPIPFRTHCVVTTDAFPGPELGGNLYYHVNAIRFDDGVDVEPYTPAALAAAGPSIARARAILADPSVLDDELVTLTESTGNLTTTGDAITLDADAGGSQIRRIELHPNDLSDAALRATLLVMEFDGQETVRVPLGDFFGGGPGISQHASLITEAHPDGTFIARWAMPFTTSATIAVEGDRDVTVRARVHVEPRPAAAGELLYFYAGWRQNDARSTRPNYDWTIADLTGRGQYVGTILNITNPDMMWWGEGDEKIYVDGETFPGYFGTGTEDYFGYAHTDTAYFSRPFHGQPITPAGPGNYGRTSNFRWHLLDPIPFRQSLRFDQEVWHWAEVDMPLDVISIWYATADTTHDDVPPTPAELVIPPL